LTDQFDILSPGGYQSAFVFVADYADTDLFSGGAMFVQAKPGEAAILVSKQNVYLATEPVIIKCSALTNSASASIALIGFNSPVDGQLAYHQAGGGSLPLNTECEMSLIYKPPGGALQIGVQIVNPSSATGTINALVDRLRVEKFIPESRSILPLEPDGSFEGNLKTLLTNINGDDGDVHLIWSANNKAIKLAVNTFETAANAGLWAYSAKPRIPDLFLVEAIASREYGAGGMMALVLTQGWEEIVLFEGGFNLLPTGEWRPMLVGGNFQIPNPMMPPLLVVQNAGKEELTSITVDDLILSSIRLASTNTGNE